MTLLARIVSLSLLLACAAPAAARDGAAAAPVSTPDQLAADLALAPCKSAERLAAVRDLFVRMGATPDEVRVEKRGGVSSLVVTLEGTGEGTVLVGAHYDKTPAGCGAIDNWSGIVAVAHLYRSLRAARPAKTFVFVAFGKEEEGLVGSRAMARAIPKRELARYCAMINVDSLGDAEPQVLRNVSSAKLTALVEETAKGLGLPFKSVDLGAYSSDSEPFRDRGIPAVTLHSLDDRALEIIHTSRDRPHAVSPERVHAGYRLALAVARRVDESPCGELR